MNAKFIAPILSAALAFSAISCGKDKPISTEKTEVTTTKDGTPYSIDTLNSKIEWKGYKIVKSEHTNHFGTIKFESGTMTVKDGKLESGNFVADLSTLENIDLKDDAEQKAKLEGHLKSGDFFEIEKFPTASYEITKVSDAAANADYNTVLDGNLTLKGITKPVQFQANVSVKENAVTIATEPKDINREDFGVKFQLPVTNGMIRNEINVQILIKGLANK